MWLKKVIITSSWAKKVFFFCELANNKAFFSPTQRSLRFLSKLINIKITPASLASEPCPYYYK